jgi:Zn finger protein HypA/HybF involved in hydrogenase expression
MYELISLKLKCPICGKSLMDESQLVDNEPSILLNVEIAGTKGEIRLSSIYGSYNYMTDVEMPESEVAKFSCTHCETHITSDSECMSCGANMVPFYLDMGGKVTICSRSGCKNHIVAFEDLAVALKKMYQEYGLAGKDDFKPDHVITQVEKPVDEDKETIESGTFLNSYCPHCSKSLLENNMLKLKIQDEGEGFLMLSPYLNVFTTKSTIFLEEDKTLKDVRCWHCDKSLIPEKKSCGKCGSDIVKIAVGARTKLIDFYICTKKGCRWHGLSEDDFFDIRLQDSLEW